jgi:hypothetical protein
MPIINPWTVMAAGKAVWNGYKWVKQMKKLKKGGGSVVKKIQAGTKPKGKKVGKTEYSIPKKKRTLPRKIYDKTTYWKDRSQTTLAGKKENFRRFVEKY